MSSQPKKPRFRMLRTKFNRYTGRDEMIYVYAFGKERRTMEAWIRCHPSIGAAPTDNRRAPGT